MIVMAINATEGNPRTPQKHAATMSTGPRAAFSSRTAIHADVAHIVANITGLLVSTNAAHANARSGTAHHPNANVATANASVKSRNFTVALNIPTAGRVAGQTRFAWGRCPRASSEITRAQARPSATSEACPCSVDSPDSPIARQDTLPRLEPRDPARRPCASSLLLFRIHLKDSRWTAHPAPERGAPPPRESA